MKRYIWHARCFQIGFVSSSTLELCPFHVQLIRFVTPLLPNPGTFTAGFDTSKISRRQGEPASASAAADASTTGKQSKSAQPERQLRALVQVNSAQLPGYNKRLTSSRQEVVLSEPVTQVSYVLTPTAGITNEDASATVSAIASASASGSAASSASAEQAKQGFKPTHKPTPAPEKGIMFMFGKLNFIVMRKIAMIWFDIARQFSKRAENPDPAIEALCTVGPVSVAFFCRKAVHTVEWVQHLFQVALGKVERTTYADYVPSFVAYQTCSGMGDAVISSCEPIDAILQIGVLALLALFISLLSFAPKRSKRGSKRGSKQEPVHEPSNIQRFTVGKSGVVGIGKSTENKITKEGKGSEQVFKEVTKSKVARVAWMASSSSSAQM